MKTLLFFLTICFVIPAILLGDVALGHGVERLYGAALSQSFLILTIICQAATTFYYLMTNRLGGK